MNATGRKQFTFYRSYYEAICSLPKREQTAVVQAICGFALNGTEPELTGVSAAIFSLIRPTLEASAKKAESGKKGGETEKQTESKTEANGKQEIELEIGLERELDIELMLKENKKKSKSFKPPTVEEVKAYCKERNNGIDPENFVNFYSAKGWKIGKEKMQDWKAAVRTWEKRNSDQVNQQPAANPQAAPNSGDIERMKRMIAKMREKE